jgi:hypothetical protein
MDEIMTGTEASKGAETQHSNATTHVPSGTPAA